MSEQELDRFVPLETSDGLSRPWYTRDEDRRRRWVQVSALSALAVFTLVVSVLLGRVDGGIRSLVGINERATEETRRVRAAGRHKIVAWCPCGRTLAANTFASRVPVEDEVCSGCFDNWGYDTSRNSLRATFPKTDYDPNEESSSHGAAPVHSFVYQMKKHNITDKVIVDECGWRREGTAYYAFGQERYNTRVCVIEAFINHMATQGWYFSIETWYAKQEDMVIFYRHEVTP